MFGLHQRLSFLCPLFVSPLQTLKIHEPRLPSGSFSSSKILYKDATRAMLWTVFCYAFFHPERTYKRLWSWNENTGSRTRHQRQGVIGLKRNVRQQLYSLNILLNPNKQIESGNKNKGWKLTKNEERVDVGHKGYLQTDGARQRGHRRQENDHGRRSELGQDTRDKGIEINQGGTHQLFIKTMTWVSAVKFMPLEAQKWRENTRRPRKLCAQLSATYFCFQGHELEEQPPARLNSAYGVPQGRCSASHCLSHSETIHGSHRGGHTQRTGNVPNGTDEASGQELLPFPVFFISELQKKTWENHFIQMHFLGGVII